MALLIFLMSSKQLMAQNDTTKINSLKTTIDSFDIKKQQLIKDSLEYKKSIDELESKIKEAKKTSKLISDLNSQLQLKRNSIKKVTYELDTLKDNYKSAIDILKKEIGLLQKDKLQYSADVKKLEAKSLMLTKKNEDDSTRNAVLKDSAVAQLNTLDSVQALLEKIKDTMVVIAEFALVKSNVDIHLVTKNIVEKQSAFYGNAGRNEYERYQNVDSSKGITKSVGVIKTINIRIKEGQILYIAVNTDKGVFRNKNSPISLTTINEKRLFDKLYLDGYESNQFVYLKDVVSYTPRRSYNYIPYSDVEFTISKKDSLYFVKESTSINFYVDVAAFTDLKGISGDANGLAQIYMSGKFITRTKNIRNKAIIPFNFVTVEGYLGKFDNNYKGVLVDSITGNVDRLKLFQTTNYRIGAKLNLLHWVLSPYPKRLIEDMQLNFGYNFAGARTLTIINKNPTGTIKIYDSIYTPVIQNQWYIEPIIRFTRNSNFGFSMSLPIIWQSVKFNAKITNSETIVYSNPTISLSYFSPKAPGNKLFFKFSQFIDLKNPDNGFTQAQLGYSASLTDVFKIK